jgi:hypothetical protein
MTDQHPITPPPELAQQWMTEFYGTPIAPGEASTYLANRTAQWAADQELEACVKWLNSYMPGNEGDRLLRTARRPKPPSLKEQALQILRYPKDVWGQLDVDTIRRALEQLPDHE